MYIYIYVCLRVCVCVRIFSICDFTDISIRLTDMEANKSVDL